MNVNQLFSNKMDVKAILSDQTQKKTISLPLEFAFLPVEILSKQFTKLNNSHKHRIHYLGPRFQNILAFHKKYAYSQKHLQTQQQTHRYKVNKKLIVDSHAVHERLMSNTSYKNTLYYRAFEGMNPYLSDKQQYIFNSIFQSGNLDCAIKIEQNEFDLFLRVDSNTKGHMHWFYFSIKNGNKKNKIKLNICNLSKAKSLYSKGMQPYVLSKKKAQLEKKQCWQQSGVNLGIQRRDLRYDILYEKMSSVTYYCLTLEYQFQHENDQVFFAYCVPYTYSKVCGLIKSLPQIYTKQLILGKSMSGIDIPLLHITNHQKQCQKKNVLITGRFHPSQSNGSYLLEGFIQFLNSKSKQADELRNRVNFFIIPMINPDGVIVGNSRCSLAGRDLNRQFTADNTQLFPEVHLVITVAKKLQEKYGVLLYLDFHGHSCKKNTFFYGPSYGICEPNYYKCRIFPKLIQKINPNFRFHSCTFNIDDQKKKTARAAMFQSLKITYTYTVETSIALYYDCEKMKTFSFNVEEWVKMGDSVARGLNKFIMGLEQYQNLIKQRRLLRQKKLRSARQMNEVVLQDEDQYLNYFKRQPLKIAYNDKSLFSGLMEQIKVIQSTKKNHYIKQIDEDEDSDDHDEKEDFQEKKMKEFCGLLKQISKTGQKKLNKEKQKAKEQYKVKTTFHQQKLSTYEQQLDFMKQFQEVSRPSTVHLENNSQSKRSERQSKTRQSPQRKEIPVLNHFRQNKKKINIRSSPKRQLSSEPEINNNTNKVGCFGQFYIFVEKQLDPTNTKIDPAKFKRNSLFSRQRHSQISRSRNRQSRQISVNFNKKEEAAFREKYHSSNDVMFSIKKKEPAKIKPKVSTSFEFKFDNVSDCKQKDVNKKIVNKQQKASTIGPASFYGIRQNINSKIKNKISYCNTYKNQDFQSFKLFKH